MLFFQKGFILIFKFKQSNNNELTDLVLIPNYVLLYFIMI